MNNIKNVLKVLVANSSEAYLYQLEHSRVDGKLKLHLTKIQDFSHHESREKNSDLMSDRSGERQMSGNIGRAYESKHDPKEMEAEKFAGILAKTMYSEIYHEANLQHEERLLVVAPTAFYNFFMKHWHHHVPIIEHLAKDYTKFALKDLTEKLCEYFLR